MYGSCQEKIGVGVGMAWIVGQMMQPVEVDMVELSRLEEVVDMIEDFRILLVAFGVLKTPHLSN